MLSTTILEDETSMGLLQVTGIIDLKQFWPEGESDADTAKVQVQVDQNAFKFRNTPRAPFKVTHVFEQATVIGKFRKKAIDSKSRITVRIQGIDAPELHYNSAPLPKNIPKTDKRRQLFKQYNKKYRQHLGEISVINLKTFLFKTMMDKLPCTVRTNVYEPKDVFDSYGRFVGDIFVTIGMKDINIGLWLVENGWVFPTFYTSMLPEEINPLLLASSKAQNKGIVWKYLQKKMGKFNSKLIYRKASQKTNDDDVGPLVMPKLFRRQCTWYVHTKAQVEKANFLNYLIKRRDGCFLVKDFLEQGQSAAPLHFLGDFVTGNGTVTIRPQNLVFREDPSKLLGTNGKEITQW